MTHVANPPTWESGENTWALKRLGEMHKLSFRVASLGFSFSTPRLSPPRGGCPALSFAGRLHGSAEIAAPPPLGGVLRVFLLQAWVFEIHRVNIEHGPFLSMYVCSSQ